MESTIETNGGLVYANMAVKVAMETTITGSSSFISQFVESLISASSSLTAETTVYPIFEVRDNKNIVVDQIHYESVHAGIATAAHVLTFINNSNSELDVTLTAKASLNQLGSALDTYDSQYLSLDGEEWSNSLLLEIPALGSLDCYFRYNPPSTAKIGEKEWEISQRDNSLTGIRLLPSWFYAKKYTIPGGDSDITNARVLLTIPYNGIMRDDFRDLRFRDINGNSFSHELIYKIDGEVAYVIVIIPTLPASPGTTEITAFSGNFLAPSTANPTIKTIYDWADGSLEPWISAISGWPASSYGPHAFVESGTWNGESSYLLKLSADWANYRGVAYKESSQRVGLWTFNFKGYNATGKLYFYLINDDSSSQAVTVNKTYGNDTATIQIERNGSSLIDTTATISNGVEYEITVLKNANGDITVYLDDVEILTTTDSTTFTNPIYLRLESWAVYYSPDHQDYYVHDVETVRADLTGPITETNWMFYVVLECYGSIMYKSQEIPGLEPEVHYGCKIGGSYYE